MEMVVKQTFLRALVVAALAYTALPATVHAQTDEIQVYDGGLAAPGTFNLTMHMNDVERGIATPAFPGAVVANRSFNTVPEWAIGVTNWFEAGAYLPVLSRDHFAGWGVDGVKLRTLFAVPNADSRRFFYGANFEFSINASRWDTKRISSEVRPIVGWHLNGYDIVVNPILDTEYDGFKNLDFAPSVRFAHALSNAMTVAVEEYADYGPLHQFLGKAEQSHQVYGVVDYNVRGTDVEFGFGKGLTSASDSTTFKVILSRDLRSFAKH